MIDIATHGGIIHEVDLQYEVMKAIMADSFIKDHQFIDFKFIDGSHGSVKKGCIEFFYESETEEV
ncbi:hypothetical protein [Clostridium sp. HBUAS56010]|uniref:hypothetical protein n=1 Tax=Clostridium sp. HBUAS56010 TaxID=2571127 RepID=UPI0011783AA9|nr:hypothetical protein [Clostridium sp. HBUAS56010]